MQNKPKEEHVSEPVCLTYVIKLLRYTHLMVSLGVTAKTASVIPAPRPAVSRGERQSKRYERAFA